MPSVMQKYRALIIKCSYSPWKEIEKRGIKEKGSDRNKFGKGLPVGIKLGVEMTVSVIIM